MVATDLHDTIEFTWTKECGMHTTHHTHTRTHYS
jgi:hypothetical protein